MMLPLAVLLALFWGIVWAVFLQYHRYGHYLAVRRTWVAVVVGVGGDLLICLCVMPLTAWLAVYAIVCASSLGIIARSLYNEHIDERAINEITR